MPSPIKNSNQGGRRENQKFKSLLVWQYLLKHTDENHSATLEEIQLHLENYDIFADRHSISRDIKALQELTELEHSMSPEDEIIEERDKLNYSIIHKRGCKIVKRPYEFKDLRLLAECVHSAKFISNRQEQRLLVAIEGLCSQYQIDELKTKVYVFGRPKTRNQAVMDSMSTIRNAIKSNHKISFTYLKYTKDSMTEQVARKKGKPYIVSPFNLIINDGNYYLLAYDTPKERITTYRLDRIRDVKLLSVERDGHTAYNSLNLDTYLRRVFSMYSTGNLKRVKLRFTNDMLDTVIDRFGSGNDLIYFFEPDKRHFSVEVEIDVSDQFYAWICGFRKKVKIENPSEVVEGFKKFLADITDRY